MGKGKEVNYLRIIPPTEMQVQLVIPEKEKPAVISTLGEIRKLFGPQGQYWIRGSMNETSTYNDTRGMEFEKQMDMFCLVGGVKKVDGKSEYPARLAISLAIDEWMVKRDVYDDGWSDGDTAESVREETLGNLSTPTGQETAIINFNDDHADWDDVKWVLSRAKKLVQKAATR